MRILITGITGFAGSHLAESALGRNEVEVYGTLRNRSRLENIEHLLPRLHLVECDIRDPFAVQSVIRDVTPDRVFHLAAQSFVPTRGWRRRRPSRQTSWANSTCWRPSGNCGLRHGYR